MTTATQVKTGGKSVRKSMNLLEELKESLGCQTRREAYIALRAVLKTLRDSMPVGEGTDFASQLAVTLKGIYYEGWKPEIEPVFLHTRAEFMEYVNEQMSESMNPEKATWHVFRMLTKLMSEGDIDDVIGTMPLDMEVYLTK